MVAIICIPITAIVVGFLVLKSVQLGLRWNMQTAEKKEPTLQTPIEKVVEAIDNRQVEKQNKYTQEMVQEYMSGIIED